MLKTFVMTGDRMELPIDLGIEKAKIEDRISEKDNWVTNSFGSMFDSLALTADEDNLQPILVSDYSEDKQDNTESVLDYVALNPKAELVLPWNRDVQALNRLMVMGQAGDILKVVAR